MRQNSGVQVGVDRHLLAGHRVEGEAGADLGHAPGTVGDHDELDHDEDEEDHEADDERPADHEVAEGLDDLAGVAVEEHEAGRADVERQPEHGGDEQQRREDGEVEDPLDVHARQQDQDGAGEVEHQQEVEDHRRQRDHHHDDDGDDRGGYADPSDLA